MITRKLNDTSTYYCDYTSDNPSSPSTSTLHIDQLTTEDIRRLAYQILAPITITIGILGNILNLLVLTTRPFIKGGTRVYLTALALSDLSVMLTVVPMLVRWTGAHVKSYPVAYFHAHVELFLNNVFISSSIFIVVCLTVDRYFSVCLPTMFRSIKRKRIARMGVVGSYVIGVGVSVPLVGLKAVCRVRNESVSSECVQWDFHENEEITSTVYWSFYLWFSESLIRFGPCVVLAILNVLIIRRFRLITAKRKVFRDALVKTNNSHLYDCVNNAKLRKALRNKKYQEEKRLIGLLRAIVILFFVTMTPSAILSLLYTEGHEDEFGFQAFRALANNLELLNFSLNFFIYFLYSKEFRVSLVAIFTSCTACEEEVSDNENNECESDGMRSIFKIVKNGTVDLDYRNTCENDGCSAAKITESCA